MSLSGGPSNPATQLWCGKRGRSSVKRVVRIVRCATAVVLLRPRVPFAG